MTKLSKRITGKIKKEQLAPEPRWKFVLRHTAFWLLFAIAVVLGAAAFSVILFVLFEADSEILEHGRFSKLHYFLTVLPLFWIIFFGLFFGLALYGVKHTKRGYRFSIWQLVTANLLGSILLGSTVYGFGGGEHFEHICQDTIPGYRGFDKHQMEIWSQPEKGLLGGTIREVSAEKIILLEDFLQKEWEIHLPTDTPLLKRILQKVEKDRFKKRRVKVIGEQTGENTFSAQRILPWRRHEPPFRRGGKKERPEEHFMQMLEMREALRRGDLERVEAIRAELGLDLPSPPPEKPPRRIPLEEAGDS